MTPRKTLRRDQSESAGAGGITRAAGDEWRWMTV